MKEHALFKLFGASAVLVASATTEPIEWHYLISMSVAVILAVAGSAFDAYGSSDRQAMIRRVGMAGVTALIVFSVLRLQYADSIQVAAFSAAVAITGKDVVKMIAESVIAKLTMAVSLLAKLLPQQNKDERHESDRGDTKQ